MPDTSSFSVSLPDTSLQSQLERLRGEHEAARLKLEIRQFEQARGAPLAEEWGDFVDRREYLTDDPTFSTSAAPSSSIDDRQGGRFRPVYETEYDLARIRGTARNLATLTAVTTGALDALANYVLAGGFKFTAQPAGDQAGSRA